MILLAPKLVIRDAIQATPPKATSEGLILFRLGLFSCPNLKSGWVRPSDQKSQPSPESQLSAWIWDKKLLIYIKLMYKYNIYLTHLFSTRFVNLFEAKPTLVQEKPKPI